MGHWVLDIVETLTIQLGLLKYISSLKPQSTVIWTLKCWLVWFCLATPFLAPLPALNFHETNPTPVLKCSNARFPRLEASRRPSVPSNHNHASPRFRGKSQCQRNQIYNLHAENLDRCLSMAGIVLRSLTTFIFWSFSQIQDIRIISGRAPAPLFPAAACNSNKWEPWFPPCSSSAAPLIAPPPHIKHSLIPLFKRGH